MKRGIAVGLAFVGLAVGLALVLRQRGEDTTAGELSPRERLDRAREFYPRIQAWAGQSDPGWFLFRVLRKEDLLVEVARHQEEEYVTRYRSDPEFGAKVDELISLYESTSLVGGHLTDARTEQDLGGAILSLQVGDRTFRASSSNMGEYWAIFPGEPGPVARVSVERRGYYPARRDQPLSHRVTTGCDFRLSRRITPHVLVGVVQPPKEEATGVFPVLLRGDWGLRWQTVTEPGGGFRIAVDAPRGATLELSAGETDRSSIPVPLSADTVQVPEAVLPARRAARVPWVYVQEGLPEGTLEDRDECPGRSFSLRMRCDLPRIVGEEELVSIPVALDWTTSGAEIDSAGIQVQALFFDAPPQEIVLPRGRSGMREISFVFLTGDMEFQARHAKIQVTARTVVSCPDREQGECRTRLFQPYRKETRE